MGPDSMRSFAQPSARSISPESSISFCVESRSTGISFSTAAICSSVAREQDPARIAARPPTASSVAACDVRSGRARARAQGQARGPRRRRRTRSPPRRRRALRDRARNGVDNRRPIALRRQLGAGARDRGAALFDGREVDQADGAFRLPLQHPHKIGIMHRIERVVLERALVQGRRADKQVAEIDRPSGFRKGRRHQSAAAMRLRAQSVRDRTNVAGVGRVESGADLVHHMPRAARADSQS